MDLNHLLSKFPSSWRGLFGALSVEQTPILSAATWLQQQSSSKYGEMLKWSDLLKLLCDEEPSIEAEDLVFKPLFFYLPISIQRNISAFTLQHVDKLPTSCVQRFIERLQQHMISDDWVKTNISLLMSSMGRNVGLVDTENVKTDKARLRNAKNIKQNEYKFTNSMSYFADELLTGLQHIDALPSSGRTVFQSQHDAGDVPSQVTSTQILSPEDSQPPTKKLRLHPLIEEDMPMFYSQVVASQDSQEISFTQQTQIPLDILTPEMEDMVHRLKYTLCTDIDEKTSDWTIFNLCSTSQMQKVCEMLELNRLTENSVANTCQAVMSLEPEISYRNCVCFVEHCLLPKVQNLNQNASRVLASVVVSITKKFPQQLIEGVCSESIKSSSFNIFQSELMCRIIKETLSAENKITLMNKITKDRLVWNEPVINVMQCFLEDKIQLKGSNLDMFLSSLELNSLSLGENLKFAKLILAVLRTYGNQFRNNNITTMQNILSCNKTFLKKSCEATLQKLKCFN